MDVPSRAEADPAGSATRALLRPADGVHAVNRRLRRAGGWGKGRLRAAASRARILQRQDHFRRLASARIVRRLYQRAVEVDGFSSDGSKIAFCVSGRDLRAGWRDLYAAVGLGRYLGGRDHEVAYFGPERWTALPPETDVVVAMLPTFDPTVVPDGCRVVAWVRDEVERWAEHPHLALFDAVLAASPVALSRLTERYDGPSGLLPVGVDTELFRPPRRRAERAGVCTAPGGGETPRHLYQLLRRGHITFPFAITRGRDALDRIHAPYGIGTPGYFKLPDLYGRALLVLDDFSPSLRADGLANPALLEALAAGALPVTNSRLPLVGLGLDEVPVCGEEKGFGAQLTELLASPERIELRALALGARVRQLHSYLRRAEELDLFLAELPAAPRRATVPLVGGYPAGDADPYRSALRAGLARDGLAYCPVPDVLADPAPHSRGRLDNYALHLHRTDRLLAEAGSAEEAAERLARLRQRVDELAGRGGKLIVTVHDVRPERWRYPELERQLGAFLAERADVVHVTGPGTAGAVAPHFHLPAEKIRVVASGSYLDRLPRSAARAAARERFGLAPDDRALLLFDQDGTYPGLELLLEAFEPAVERDPRLRLVVAGAPGDAAALDPRLRRGPAADRIVPALVAVPEEELQLYFKAADVVVLPEPPLRDSPVLPLALTFGRPLVAPATPEEELPDPRFTITFVSGYAESLSDALLAAVELDEASAARAAREAAERYPAEEMGRDYAALVRDLLGAARD
ncbi:hypothetical protein AB0J86_23930 [Micromonospora sp. NPDC049559]|uniref:hypothetical protein n=1 Tax=Micromonospora sp. NPDC049559 TaxID=3155923 RepID=UPI0034416F76